jgi:hypothetical protein
MFTRFPAQVERAMLAVLRDKNGTNRPSFEHRDSATWSNNCESS